MIENARLLGADGIVPMRFDSSEIGQQFTEIAPTGPRWASPAPPDPAALSDRDRDRFAAALGALPALDEARAPSSSARRARLGPADAGALP